MFFTSFCSSSSPAHLLEVFQHALCCYSSSWHTVLAQGCKQSFTVLQSTLLLKLLPQLCRFGVIGAGASLGVWFGQLTALALLWEELPNLSSQKICNLIYFYLSLKKHTTFLLMRKYALPAAAHRLAVSANKEVSVTCHIFSCCHVPQDYTNEGCGPAVCSLSVAPVSGYTPVSKR